MDKVKHTPGPWIVDHTVSGFEVINEETLFTVARIPTGQRSASVSLWEANARLIAAAPDLLAALDRILRAHDSRNDGSVMGEAVLCAEFAAHARAAIAKATGNG